MIADAVMTASGSLIELARRNWIVLLFVICIEKVPCVQFHSLQVPR